MAKFSELLGDGVRSASNYFTQVQRSTGLVPLNVFATTNNRFSLDRQSREAHVALEAELLSDSIKNKLLRLRRVRVGEPPTVVFTRAGSQLNLKLLLATSRRDTPCKATAIGACALHANDYVESDDTSSLSSGLLPVVTEFAAVWELLNPRDMAPLLRRSYYIFNTILRQNEHVRSLVKKELGIEIEDVLFAGLPYSRYFPLLFGLYITARNGVTNEATSIVDANDLAKKAEITPAEFLQFASAKALTLGEARQALEPIDTFDDFRGKVENSMWVFDSRLLRRKPLLALPDGRYLVSDIQFLVENASAGLFWDLMAQLKTVKARHMLSGFWGNTFEAYVRQFVQHYVPGVVSNVQLARGDTDLLITTKDAVVIFEIKAGLIAQDVKASRDESRLEAELRKRYVVDQDGNAKGVRQLANSAKALRQHRVSGGEGVIQRVYPVLVVEDPLLQAIAMNAYLNSLFEEEIDRLDDVAPLTVMLIDELEELLPYVQAGDVSWRDLFDARVVYGAKVVAPPVHTTFVELAVERKLRRRGDSFLRGEGNDLIDMITTAYAQFLKE